MIELIDIKNQIASLNKLIEDKISEPQNNRYPIYDGAVNVEKYFSSSIKIAWLLKEAYDDKEGTGGDWNYSDLLGKDTVYKDFFSSHDSRATWHPIIYISYGILNNFMLWNDMEYIRKNPEMSYIVRNIAIINTHKLPAKNLTNTNFSDIQIAFDKYKSILYKQLEILNPDILIGCGTMNLYKGLFDLNEEDAIHYNSISCYFKNNKIYIDAYHPAQRTIDRETYVDEIILAVKDWYEKYKK